MWGNLIGEFTKFYGSIQKMTIIKILLVIVVILFNFLFYKSEIISILSVRGPNLQKEDNYSANYATFNKLREDALEFSGWSEKDKIGLSLDPGGKGVALYRFQKPKNTKVIILEPYFDYPKIGRSNLSFSLDGEKWQTLVENKTIEQESINLTSLLKDREVFFIKFKAENNVQKDQDPSTSPILKNFTVLYFKKEIQIPNFSFILLSLFIPIFIILGGLKNPRALFPFLLLISILSLGLHLSLEKLSQERYHSLDVDTVCLMNAVKNFQFSSLKNGILGNFCGTKESGIIIIYLLFYKIFGFGSELAVRFSGIFFHLLTIIIVFIYGRKVNSILTASVASFFIATHPYLVSLSIRGLRDTVFIVATTLFIYLLFEKDLRFLKNKFLIFLSAIFLIYLRLHSLIQLAFITLIFGFSKTLLFKSFVFFKQAVFLLTMLFLVSLPVILVNLKIYNTWNYSEMMHTRWNANVEFAGKPSFPSAESVARDPFQGKPVSTFDYFFRLHTPQDLIISSYKGMLKTFNDLYFPYNPKWLLFFIFIIGSVLMIKRKVFWYIPFLVFFLEIPLFFLAEKNLVESRSLTQSLPFIALILGFAIEKIMMFILPFFFNYLKQIDAISRWVQ